MKYWQLFLHNVKEHYQGSKLVWHITLIFPKDYQTKYFFKFEIETKHTFDRDKTYLFKLL